MDEKKSVKFFTKSLKINCGRKSKNMERLVRAFWIFHIAFVFIYGCEAIFSKTKINR
jgi:hypothetical protein